MTALAFLARLPRAALADLLDALDARLCAFARVTHEPLDHESDY